MLCHIPIRRAPLRHRQRSLATATFILVLLTTSIAGTNAAAPKGGRPDRSGHKKLDRYLQQVDRLASPDDPVRVIVTARKGASEKVKSAVAGSGVIVHEHKSIDAVTAEVPVGQLHFLAERDDVLSVSVDAPVHAGADSLGTLAENALLPTLGLKDKNGRRP